MKIGLVGVGPWGQTLAKKFVERGHEIPFHDRHGPTTCPAPMIGTRRPWFRMIGEVNALVVAAPPPVTTGIASYCARTGVPILVTKPLLGASQILADRWTSPFAVDYVHLHSPLMKSLGDVVREKEIGGISIKKMTVSFWGPGPVRSFSPLLDYGPHAVSAALYLLDACQLDVVEATRWQAPIARDQGREFWTAKAALGSAEVTFEVGNLKLPWLDEQKSSVLVIFSDNSTAQYAEVRPHAYLTVNGSMASQTDNHDPLGLLVDSFAACVASGDDEDPKDLETSVYVEETLTKIAAKGAQ